MLNVPLALIGGVAALYLSGLYLSVPSSIGFIAVFGTAVLNGVVMVNAINQNLDGGMGQRQAILDGALSRLRPVLMTALTTLLGLVPLLYATGVGSEVQRPLATVVVGGLAVLDLAHPVRPARALPESFPAASLRAPTRPTPTEIVHETTCSYNHRIRTAYPGPRHSGGDRCPASARHRHQRATCPGRCGSNAYRSRPRRLGPNRKALESTADASLAMWMSIC